MQKIPCVVIKDLLPSYVDGLTSEETNQLIQEHVAECADCSAILAAMQEPTPAAPEDRKEIDFLKKNRKKNIKVLIGSLIACIVLAAGVIGLRTFVIGSPSIKGLVACDVKVTNGETKTLVLDGMVVDSLHAVSKVEIEEEKGGIIRVNTRVVPANPLYPSGSFHKEYIAKENIFQVWLDDRIIWENGAAIPLQTADLFETRHDYIGDMPANAQLARHLQVESIIGPYENELETASEPYEWKLILLEDRTVPDEKLDALAYCMLGLVRNLGQVTFQGPSFSKTVTMEDADAFFQWDIKECGNSAMALAQLLQKTGLFYASAEGFTPDRMAIIWPFDTTNQIVKEKDPEIVENYYQKFRNIQLSGKFESVESKDHERIMVAFYDSKTGQRIQYEIVGPYMEIQEKSSGYFSKIEGGEELYEALCALKKE